MPSLRRTISSPNVHPARSAPHPYLAVPAATRAHGHGPRRTSGSETTGRRVLADIEWWRVYDGQRDLDDSAEDENQEQNDTDVAQPEQQDVPDDVVDVPSDEMARLSISGSSADVTLSPLAMGASGIDGFATGDSDEVMSPTSQFAALSLSITPVTPPLGRRRHTLQSSSSSTESTPESLLSHSLTLPDVSFGSQASEFPDILPLCFPPSTLPRARSKPAPLSSVRAFSFNDLDFVDAASEGRFSDAGLQSPRFGSFGFDDAMDGLFY